MRRLAARCLVAALAAALAAPVAGCKRHGGDANGVGADPASVAAPFAVRDDSEGLLLTWIDEKGDFHVEQKTADVPLVGRDAVRVVDPNKEEGTHPDKVFVADLRVAGSDGAYPVHAMTREEFDALAEQRRAKNGATLASAERGDGGALPSGGSGGANANPNANANANANANQGAPLAGRPAVIIYGASWCGACKQAEAYLKKRGISYIDKDIEEDPQAATEMRGKLRRAGKPAGSIPVLDVRGRILVGFDARSVDEALGSPI
jgi:glutaredoxin